MIIVLFEVTLKTDKIADYLGRAAALKELLAQTPGFVSAERFSSLATEGKLLSMSIWEDEESVARWRNVLDHRMSQKEGREKLFESYKITVCSVLREYNDTDRAEAPKDSNAYFEV